MFFFSLTILGQQKNITGTVSDKTEVLPGVSVLIKGTTSGGETDFDGKYTIKAKVGDVLVFSYLGYKTVEKTVGTSTVINVKMVADNLVLDEVVVVAYGSQTKKSIVGAVEVVGSDAIEKQQVTSPLRALQGTVPGVNLLTSGGQPGSNPTIRIRGFGSINASQDPLVILDGAAFNGNLNTISQDQIASISVLKDASSTALYGSRGANGVIVITTKKGRKNSDTKITVRSQIGVSNPTVGLHDRLGTEQLLKYNWEALKNTNQYVNGQSASLAAQNASLQLIDILGYNPYSVPNPIDANGDLVSGAALLWQTDWEQEVLRRNYLRQNHNISLSGGNENTTYFMSADYLDEQGSVITSNFERISTRLNLESQVKDWLKIGLNTSFSTSLSGNPDQTSGSTTQSISWIYRLSSVYPVYLRDADGNLLMDSAGGLIYDLGNGQNVGQAVNSVRPVNGGENILASLYLGKETRKRTNYLANIYAEVKLFEGLKFKTNYSYENYVFDSFSFDDDLQSFAASIGGRVSQDRDITTTVNAVQSLNYSKGFGRNNVSVDFITEAYTFMKDDLGAQGTGFLPDVANLDGSTLPESVRGNVVEERLNSYLGRFSYNLDKKYFAEFSYRRDGSTRFSENTRWGNFFSIGASWVISDENFLKDSNVISYLKLRGSYGELGNNRGIGLFPYQSLFSLGWNNEGNTGVLLNDLNDENLTWETTASTNVGVDFSLFDGKIRGSVDYYNKESVDLIYDQPAASSNGIQNITTNIGAVRNYGWEVSLQSTNISTEDFTWSTGINFSLDENEITELTQDEFINGSKLWKVGNSLFDFYIREWAGVDPADGFGMWYIDVEDADGNVIGRDVTKNYNEASRYQQGSSIPDIVGGFTSNFAYKQLLFLLIYN
jgi:TonB-linked SusC/RagA family outer membrane protein